MDGMNILITGCNGQLGNEMQLLAKHNSQHRYFFTDIVVPEGMKASMLDITKQEDVNAFVQENHIDCIVFDSGFCFHIHI